MPHQRFPSLYFGVVQAGGVKTRSVEIGADLHDHEQPGAQPVNLHVQNAVLAQMRGDARPDALMLLLVLRNQRR